MTIDIEAIKRAIDGVNTLPAGDTVAMLVTSRLYNDIQKALSALRPVAEGKAVIVPVEPTPQMRHAFHDAHEKCLDGGLDEYGNEMWSPDFEWAAMIGAME